MNEWYRSSTNPATSGVDPPYLSEAHARMFAVGSAIGPAEIAESGARTILRGRDLPEVYSRRQRERAPGILFPVVRPNGKTSSCFRPDETDPENPGHRYEAPCKARGGPGNVLGVLPSQHHLIPYKSVPVIFVEGQKKQLSLITAARKAGVDVLVVAIVGVWNWLHDGGKPIPDMADVPLSEGRSATVMFDSDMLRKVEVQDAAKRLAEYLQERGATPYVTYFADAPDGSKVGADDFFAAGGTFAELRMLTRRYDPADFVKIRLSRDERLQAMLEDLHHTYEAIPATKQAECSMRAAMRHIIPRAEAGGKPVEGGILLRIPSRPLANAMRASQPTAAKTLARLVEHGYAERVEEPKRKIEKHGAAYILKASTSGRGRAQSYQHREEGQQHNVSQEQSEHRNPLRNAELPIGDNSTRASQSVPELRSSKVVHTWARREGRRVVVDSEYVYRLAKLRQEILMYLVGAGGEASEAELLERFGSRRTRPRDFHRRKIAPLLGYRYTRDKETGIERRLETGPPIVACAGGMVSILPEWREALEEHRRATDEDGDTARQEQRYRQQSKAYRNRDRTPADEQPSPLQGKERVRRIVADRRREDKERWVEEQRQKVGETAATFLADELAGCTHAVRFKEVRERWAHRGGRVEELRKAVLYGPWRFVLESDGEPYIYPEGQRRSYVGPNERLWRGRQAKPARGPDPPPKPKMPPKVDGVYQHAGECDCWLCGEEPPAASYARIRGTA